MGDRLKKESWERECRRCLLRATWGANPVSWKRLRNPLFLSDGEIEEAMRSENIGLCEAAESPVTLIHAYPLDDFWPICGARLPLAE